MKNEEKIDLGPFIARYCEIKPKVPSCMAKDTKVTKEQTIGKIQKLTGISNKMCHFEMYSGIEKGR
jgi:hypothetical protein